MSAQYIAAYQDPDFQQFLPKGPNWQLSQENPRFGALRYVDPDTGAQAVVPNIWYNQPVSQRVKAMLYYADQNEQGAARLETDPFRKPWDAEGAARQRREAARLRALADEMQRTGRVLA